MQNCVHEPGKRFAPTVDRAYYQMGGRGYLTTSTVVSRFEREMMHCMSSPLRLLVSGCYAAIGDITHILESLIWFDLVLQGMSSLRTQRASFIILSERVLH